MNDQPEPDSAFHARCSALSGAVPEAEVAQLRKDKERLDWLEARGVDKIYFHDKGELNPASQSLRAAIDQTLSP